MAPLEELDMLCRCPAEVHIPRDASRKPYSSSIIGKFRPVDAEPLINMGVHLLYLSIRPGESFKLTGWKTDVEGGPVPELNIPMDEIRSYCIENNRVHNIVTGENRWIQLRFPDSKEYPEFYRYIQEAISVLSIPIIDPELESLPNSQMKSSQKNYAQKPTTFEFLTSPEERGCQPRSSQHGRATTTTINSKEEERGCQQYGRQPGLTATTNGPLLPPRQTESLRRVDDQTDPVTNKMIPHQSSYLDSEAMSLQSQPTASRNKSNISRDNRFYSGLDQSMISMQAVRQKKNMERVTEEIRQHRLSQTHPNALGCDAGIPSSNAFDPRSNRDNVLSAKTVRDEAKPRFFPFKSIARNEDGFGKSLADEHRILVSETELSQTKEDIADMINRMKLHHPLVNGNAKETPGESKSRLGRSISKENWINNSPDVITGLNFGQPCEDGNGMERKIESKLRTNLLDENLMQRSGGSIPREGGVIVRENSVRRSVDSKLRQEGSSDREKLMKIPVDSVFRPGQSTAKENFMEMPSGSISREGQLSARDILIEIPGDSVPRRGLLLMEEDFAERPVWSESRDEESFSTENTVEGPGGKITRYGRPSTRKIVMERRKCYPAERLDQSFVRGNLAEGPDGDIPRSPPSAKSSVGGSGMERPATLKKPSVPSRQTSLETSTYFPASIPRTRNISRSGTNPPRATAENGGHSFWNHGECSLEPNKDDYYIEGNDILPCNYEKQDESNFEIFDQVVFKIPKISQTPSTQTKILPLAKPVNGVVGLEVTMIIQPDVADEHVTRNSNSSSSRSDIRNHLQQDEDEYLEPRSSDAPTYYNSTFSIHDPYSQCNINSSSTINLSTSNCRSKSPISQSNSKVSFRSSLKGRSKGSQTASAPKTAHSEPKRTGGSVSGRSMSSSESSGYVEIIEDEQDRTAVQNSRRTLSGNSRATSGSSRNTPRNTGTGAENSRSLLGNSTRGSSAKWSCPMCHFDNSSASKECICSFRKEKMSGPKAMAEEILRVSNSQR